MRLRRALVAVLVCVGAIGLGAPGAHAAGIVTHAWMALDAIDHVGDTDLRALLVAHRDQVRAGAEFPDGGYWTRSARHARAATTARRRTGSGSSTRTRRRSATTRAAAT